MNNNAFELSMTAIKFCYPLLSRTSSFIPPICEIFLAFTKSQKCGSNWSLLREFKSKIDRYQLTPRSLELLKSMEQLSN